MLVRLDELEGTPDRHLERGGRGLRDEGVRGVADQLAARFLSRRCAITTSGPTSSRPPAIDCRTYGPAWRTNFRSSVDVGARVAPAGPDLLGASSCSRKPE